MAIAAQLRAQNPDLVGSPSEIVELLETAKRIHPDPDGPWHIFLDEITTVFEWQKGIEFAWDRGITCRRPSSARPTSSGSEFTISRQGIGFDCFGYFVYYDYLNILCASHMEAEKMTTTPLKRTFTPDAEEVRQARQTREAVEHKRRQTGSPLELVVRGEDGGELRIPDVFVRILFDALDAAAAGHSVGIVALEEELTTQEAADLLNVSRPFLVGLLEKGEMPFRKTGSHRRIRLADVLEYKRRRDEEAERSYRELVAENQKLGLGYD